MKLYKRIAAAIAGTAGISLLLTGSAAAHVTVKPAEVETAARQTFTVAVPNEKPIPTVSVKVVIPKGVTAVMPFQKSGWTIATEKTGTGEAAAVTSITWTGGRITDGLRDEFAFGAKVPDDATELVWKAYQTYGDGTVVSWDQSDEGDSHGASSNTGPYSTTAVVTETDAESRIAQADRAAADARSVANRSMYVASVAIALALGSVYLATRKK